MPSPTKRPNLDSVTTINDDGSRFFLHPADVRGRFTGARRLFGYFLIAIYVALPWIQVKGHPALFLDVAQRRFHFFGLTFFPQDLWLVFFLISGLGFSLFYVTSLFGRLWCGWACPYTVFLDHVFRRIERLVDGDAPARRRLDAAPWSGPKVVRRVVKHGLYFLAATIIAHIFLSYFVSLPRLYEFMRMSPTEHATAFAIVAFLSVVLYFCFSWFREQFCIVLCPYGRIQSALTDDDTMVIGYDLGRGEPRGHVNQAGAGDCIDCRRCVQVCPTGIDIRNGLQMECIGCSACVDACDAIMEKVGRPKGLVRYDSLNGLQGRATRFVRPRTILYSVLLLLGAAFLTFNLATRLKPFNIQVMRMKGMPYFVTGEGVRNQFQLRLQSKSSEPTRFSVTITGAPEGALITGIGDGLGLAPEEEQLFPFTVTIPKAAYTGPVDMAVEVHSESGRGRESEEFRFLGPDARFLQQPAPPEGGAAPSPDGDAASGSGNPAPKEGGATQ